MHTSTNAMSTGPQQQLVGFNVTNNNVNGFEAMDVAPSQQQSIQLPQHQQASIQQQPTRTHTIFTNAHQNITPTVTDNANTLAINNTTNKNQLNAANTQGVQKQHTESGYTNGTSIANPAADTQQQFTLNG